MRPIKVEDGQYELVRLNVRCNPKGNRGERGRDQGQGSGDIRCNTATVPCFTGREHERA